MKKQNQQWATPYILSDLPLQGEEKSSFYFQEIAITMARLIANPKTHTPLTLGISGKWGSGKTTLLMRVKALLDIVEDKGKLHFANTEETAQNFRKCKTVWFDAWKYDTEDKMLVALVRVMIQAMKSDGLIDQLNAWLEDPNQPSYDLVAMFLNAFEINFSGLGLGVKLKVDPQKHAVPSKFEQHTAFFDYFSEAFERLLAIWVHGKGDFAQINENRGVLVVFIDDLDRCLPEKTIQLLEAVKLFLDKRGCVFVLGADTHIIQKAITKHYLDSGVTDSNVGDYLEKIIQLRFELPPISEFDISSYVEAQAENDDFAVHGKIVASGAEANPRKVKAFLNDLRLRWTIWQNTGQAGDVNFDDFVRWEVLMRVAPKFRSRVYGFMDSELRFQFVQRAFDLAEGKEDVAALKDDINEQSLSILRLILPYRERFTISIVNRLLYVTTSFPGEMDTEEAIAWMEGLALEHGAKLEELTTLPEQRLAAKRQEALRRKGQIEEQSKAWAGIKFVLISKGVFLMGSKRDNKLAVEFEFDQHPVDLNYDFWISKYPITNADFAKFVDATNYNGVIEMSKTLKFEENMAKEGYDWRHPLGPQDSYKHKLDHPVVQVTWYDALAFCRWLNQANEGQLPSRLEFRLPTEAEWEKAARGQFGNEWPWGNEFDPNKCNSADGASPIRGTVPVVKYSQVRGDSPYGVSDMVGNVWEWVQSLISDYPYQSDDGREDLSKDFGRITRGGSFSDIARYVRSAYRVAEIPYTRSYNRGFRIVLAPKRSS